MSKPHLLAKLEENKNKDTLGSSPFLVFYLCPRLERLGTLSLSFADAILDTQSCTAMLAELFL
jgi:hypothetical protein